MLYPILRKILFRLPPETTHALAMRGLSSFPLFSYTPPSAWQKKLMGLTFSNPIGLGAGFDKNACYLQPLSKLGFGFIEIGTVTPLPQIGNPSPRLFRLPQDNALINRMGFNNDGAQAIQKRLSIYREKSTSSMIIGGNIGKNKQTTNENAIEDYNTCFSILHEVVDYFVVNVSSPNTPGLRQLQEVQALKKILCSLQNINHGKASIKPILLKISPDLEPLALIDITQLLIDIHMDGIIVSNTSIQRNNLLTNPTTIHRIGAGGLSGKPIYTLSNDALSLISQQAKKRLTIIASGGVFNATHAKHKMHLGADLIQVWTGFIYQGPAIVKQILSKWNE